MKKKNKKWHCVALSVPIIIYSVAILLSAFFILISYCIKGCVWYKELLINLGYGIAASAVVSLLIDIGSTKRKRDQERMIYVRMVADLKNACSELPSEVYTAVYEAFGYDNNCKLTFDEWAFRLFAANNDHSEKQKKEMAYAVQAISLIKKKAVELREVMKVLLNNAYVTEKLEKNIEQLISLSSRAERELSRKNYDECKSIITKEMKKCIIEIFEDLKDDYTRKYNEEEYIEE